MRASIKLLFILLLCTVPVGVAWYYQRSTAWPSEITLASGPLGGRYHDLSVSLANEIERQLKVKVHLLSTEGSLENLNRLREGEVDFAMYQPETQRFIEGHNNDAVRNVRCVSNLYSEVVHIMVRLDAGVGSPLELKGKRVSLGMQHSGDYATSRILLEHLGLQEDDLRVTHLNYGKLPQAFRKGEVDAAILTAGLPAPVLHELTHSTGFEIVSVPFAEAFARKHVSISLHTIPAGYYRSQPEPIPPAQVDTVGLRAQLLTRVGVSTSLVEAVTAIVMSENFQRINELDELFGDAHRFATSKTEFELHEGADHYHHPELRPLLNPDFVEGTEGLRSFIVSVLVAGWLCTRWWRKRGERQQEHKLDRFVKSLLGIEQRQLGLDDVPGGADIAKLQQLLDEVTSLRQEALAEFSAHELNEDRSVDCFIQMCHALSDKINAKLTRQRMDKCFAELSQRDRSDASISDVPSS